jgi:hypothetical protein
LLGSSCFCCCSICPSINESTSTRLAYAFILLIVTSFCAIGTSSIFYDDFNDQQANLIKSSSILSQSSLFVYKLSFGMIIFFFILMILTIGVKTSDDYRAKLHNGFWLVKIFALLSLIVFCFQIPFHNSLSICKYIYVYS